MSGPVVTGRGSQRFDRLELVAEVNEIGTATSADEMAALDPIEQPAQPAFNRGCEAFTGTDAWQAEFDTSWCCRAYRWLAKSLVANDVDTVYTRSGSDQQPPGGRQHRGAGARAPEAGDWHLTA